MAGTDANGKSGFKFTGDDADVLLPAVGINLDSGNDVMAHLGGFSTFANTKQKSLSDLRLWANIDPFAPDAELSLLDDG